MLVHIHKRKPRKGTNKTDWQFVGSVKYKMGDVPLKRLDKNSYRVEEAANRRAS